MNNNPPLEVSASRHFMSWLHTQQLSLALTTYQSSRLLLLGLRPNGQLVVIERTFDRAMGLAATPDRLYMSARRQLWRFDNALSPGQLYREEYDKVYIPRVGYTTGDLDMHDLALVSPQIAADWPEPLVFVNTQYNCLAALHPQHSFTPLWQPPFISKLAAEDRCHLNGLAVVDGLPRYVTLVSRSDVIDGWRDKRRDGGLLMDIQSNNILLGGLSMPHSPRFHLGRLWLLNSGQGEFGYVDLERGIFEPVAFCPGYARGLAFYNNYAIVGMSKPREKTFQGLALDERLAERHTEARCGLLVINLDSGDTTHWLRIEGEVTELYDVQLLPGVRRGRVLGFQTDEVDQLITFAGQDEASPQIWDGVAQTPSPEVQPETVQVGREDDEASLPAAELTDLSRTRRQLAEQWQQKQAIGGAGVVKKVSELTPPPDAGKKIIAFSLWGDIPKYTVGAVKNADLALMIYPGWVCRFYVDNTVPPAILEQLSERTNVEIVKMKQKGDWQSMFWRFYPAGEADVEALIVRDVDSRLSWRERTAVDVWLKSEQPFHIMRDHPLHRAAISGGMWGVKGLLLKDIKGLIESYLQEHPQQASEYSIDQYFLGDVVFPIVKDKSLVHDEFMAKKPFPTPRHKLDYVGRPFSEDDQPNPEFDDALQKYLNAKKPAPQKQRRGAPSAADSHFNLGQKFKQRGNLERAAASFRDAIRLRPNFVAAHNNLGTTLQRLGNLEEAVTCYERAIQLDPNLAEARSNLASVWLLQGDLERGRAGFMHALKLKPGYVPSLFNLGKLLRQQGRLQGAIVHLEQVLAAQPDYPEVNLMLGQMYEFMGHVERALAYYKQEAAVNPDVVEMDSFISLARLRLCDWQEYEARVAAFIASVEASIQEDKTQATLHPFSLSSFPASLELHKAVAERFAEGVQLSVSKSVKEFQQIARQGGAFKREWPDKLRIGYFSPDLRDHAVGRLVRDIFQLHDREQFEIYAYSLVPANDAITQTIRTGCDAYLDIFTFTPEDAARRIHEDGVHILIDLAGYTMYSRPQVLAFQPAPVQALFMGYPDTMGGDFVQYLLADEWLAPPELAPYFTEQFMLMPHAFVGSAPEFTQRDLSRAKFGLPDEGTVFACFNAHYKIEPNLFDIWMRILKQTPGSVLWLSKGRPAAMRNLHREAEQRGIAPERVIFAERVPEEDYIARYQLVDLFLDTYFYSAGSTAVAALQGGTPMLTCLGQTNSSRMGASIVAAAGLEMMICDTLENYEQRAVHLATHPQELAEIRRQLIENHATAPLFDPAQFTRYLEQACRTMWEGYLNQEM